MSSAHATPAILSSAINGDLTSTSPVVESTVNDTPNAKDSEVNTTQFTIFKSISASTYMPKMPLLPPAGWDEVQYSGDPALLDCLEALAMPGSATWWHGSKHIYTRMHIQKHISVRGALLSNATFQHLAHKMGVDEEPTDVYSKGAGDAFEHWLSDLFTPLVTAVMEGVKPKPKLPTLAIRRTNIKTSTTAEKRPKRGVNRTHTTADPSASKAKKRKERKRMKPINADANPSSFPTCAFSFTVPHSNP
ncbi:hypothetical protein B0H13DRAFT_2318483 [Mycena leptocephala]|nr:hypothetical protein B0H13DRAFT_2318483 [Mycena leptocephala]